MGDLGDDAIKEWIEAWPVRALYLLYTFFEGQARDPRNAGYPNQKSYRALADMALNLYLATYAVEEGASP